MPTTNGTGRKKSYGCDLEKEEKLDWSYRPILRGESLLREVNEFIVVLTQTTGLLIHLKPLVMLCMLC